MRTDPQIMRDLLRAAAARDLRGDLALPPRQRRYRFLTLGVGDQHIANVVQMKNAKTAGSIVVGRQLHPQPSLIHAERRERFVAWFGISSMPFHGWTPLEFRRVN